MFDLVPLGKAINSFRDAANEAVNEFTFDELILGAVYRVKSSCIHDLNLVRRNSDELAILFVGW